MMPAKSNTSASAATSLVRQGTLNQAQIIDAAIDLLDEGGIGAVSTRRLAERLGVSSPTLYWHVKNKAELLDLVTERLCRDAFTIDADAPWRVLLEQGRQQFRSLVRWHRDVAVLLRERPATGPNRLGHIDTTLRILLDAGLSPRDAARFSRLLVSIVLAPPPVTDPFPAPFNDDNDRLAAYPSVRCVAPELAVLEEDELFGLGVQVILDSIAQRIARTEQDSRPFTDPAETVSR